MVVTFPPYPIPVITPHGDGHILYVKSNGMWQNDEFCIALSSDGQLMHFNTKQLKVHHNGTYDIAKHLAGKHLTTLNPTTNGDNPKSQTQEESSKTEKSNSGRVF